MPAPTKPTLPPFWKWLMRVTFAVTMVLFLAPTVYVAKYYAVDKPREEAISRDADGPPHPISQDDADLLPLGERHARYDPDPVIRQASIQSLGRVLREPYIGLKRPLECLSAKATLADLATKDKDPAVRAAASEELGKVAQGGAVIRR